MSPQHYMRLTANDRGNNNNFCVFFVLMFVVFLLCLFAYILLTINRLLPIKEIEKHAFTESDFQQTEYWIYDRGGQSDNCDRLIVVRPFEWYLLNTNKQLFLVDPDRPINCGANKVSALRILRDSLIECCLDLSFDSLLQLYDRKDSVPFVRIPFTIKDNHFTIYTAINELALNYLDFEPNPKSLHSFAKLENVYSIHNCGYNLTGLLTSRFLRSLDDTKDDNNTSINKNTSTSRSGIVPTLVEADRIRAQLHAEPTKEEIRIQEILDADDREIEARRAQPYNEKEALQHR